MGKPSGGDPAPRIGRIGRADFLTGSYYAAARSATTLGAWTGFGSV